MGWFGDFWKWITEGIAKFIHDSSWMQFSYIAGAIIIVLAVIGLITFWWLLLHKFMNFGGDH